MRIAASRPTLALPLEPNLQSQAVRKVTGPQPSRLRRVTDGWRVGVGSMHTSPWFRGPGTPRPVPQLGVPVYLLLHRHTSSAEPLGRAAVCPAPQASVLPHAPAR